MKETWVQSLGQETSPGEGNDNHSSILAWRMPRTEDSPWDHKESDMTKRITDISVFYLDLSNLTK